MKRKNSKYVAKCPSCQTAKHATELKVMMAEMDKIDWSNYSKEVRLAIDNYGFFVNSDFSWACDTCLQSGKAIMGNPASQNYCWSPNYAYYDSNKTCRTCKSKFTFAKEEKKYWYESLKFWIDSEPVNCLNCRKEIRQYKIENKVLSEILRKEEQEISKLELEQVIEIYRSWQKEQKVKYYESILRKREQRS